jgi:hypothetical protein
MLLLPGLPFTAASQATALLGALVGSSSGKTSVDRGIAQLRASWLLLEAPPGASSIPVNRDGEPEEASTRWAGTRCVLSCYVLTMLLCLTM